MAPTGLSDHNCGASLYILHNYDLPCLMDNLRFPEWIFDDGKISSWRVGSKASHAYYTFHPLDCWLGLDQPVAPPLGHEPACGLAPQSALELLRWPGLVFPHWLLAPPDQVLTVGAGAAAQFDSAPTPVGCCGFSVSGPWFRLYINFASFCWSSERPCESILDIGSKPPHNSDLHDNLLWTQTAICLDLEIELSRFSDVIKGFIIPRCFFFLGIVAYRPFFLHIGFKPIGCMP